jgi:hypothetical protein
MKVASQAGLPVSDQACFREGPGGIPGGSVSSIMAVDDYRASLADLHQ